MRSSGILLPVSSLPSPYGIGTMGAQAYRFVDFLQRAGQSDWQVLPIGPTGYGDSPYQSFSSFAGNPYLIDLDLLCKQGLLTARELAACTFGDDPSRVDYGALFGQRFTLLRLAAKRFDFGGGGFARFTRESAGWLEDYALFMALKEEQGMGSFSTWPLALRLRDEAALAAARERLAEDLRFWRMVQFLFYKQWLSLKSYANEHGVSVIGDIPIYVSPDSADLWAHRELFLVDDACTPSAVAGCPPDAFSADGQLWGNPLYNWPVHLKTGCAWWLLRLRHAGLVFNTIRIDHFRGFESYYTIPAGDKTAANGHWCEGPGMSFIRVVKEKLPELSIIAEDLGYLTDGVKRLLKGSGFPGMKVLQFAFDSRESGDYLPHNYQPNSVVYTGTHDNTTTADWQRSAPPADVALAREYLGLRGQGDVTAVFIRAALSSVCDTCIIPLQDYLGLGAAARMNTPSTLGGNWLWRVREDALTDDLAGRLHRLATLYGRA